MVRVKVERKGSGGPVVALEGRGHAGFAEKGRDVVCAAISVLFETLGEGLRRLGFSPKVSRRGDGGFYRVELSAEEASSREAQVAFELISVGIEGVAAAYPDHVRFEESSWEEVEGDG